jgi:hypothetical protein
LSLDACNFVRFLSLSEKKGLPLRQNFEESLANLEDFGLDVTFGGDEGGYSDV